MFSSLSSLLKYHTYRKQKVESRWGEGGDCQQNIGQKSGARRSGVRGRALEQCMLGFMVSSVFHWLGVLGGPALVQQNPPRWMSTEHEDRGKETMSINLFCTWISYEEFWLSSKWMGNESKAMHMPLLLVQNGSVENLPYFNTNKQGFYGRPKGQVNNILSHRGNLAFFSIVLLHG